MKPVATLVPLAAAISLGLAAQASAYSLDPKSTVVSAVGTAFLQKNGLAFQCAASFTAYTDAAGLGEVVAASFSGSLCQNVTVANLPWPVTAVTATTVSVDDVTLVTGLGVCGPSTITATLSGGVLSFTSQPLSGGCSASGALSTSPTLSIVSP